MMIGDGINQTVISNNRVNATGCWHMNKPLLVINKNQHSCPSLYSLNAKLIMNKYISKKNHE